MATTRLSSSAMRPMRVAVLPAEQAASATTHQHATTVFITLIGFTTRTLLHQRSRNLSDDWFNLAAVEHFRLTSDFPALLRSPAARTLLLLLVILLPLTWLLASNFASTANSTLRTLYAVGTAAPMCGIIVAIFSFLGFLIRRMRTVARFTDQISLAGTGVSFPRADLAAVQLFQLRGHSYAALIPHHISERLTPDTARTGEHNLGGYIVEFPERPNLQPYELADRLVAENPVIRVDKLGAV